MPPKPVPAVTTKKRGEKDKKELLSAEEENILLQREIESLKHAYAMAVTKADEADANVRVYRVQLHDLHEDFKTEEKRAFDVIADMTRQYKALKEDFVRQTQRLTDEVNFYKDKLREADVAYTELQCKHEAELAMKDATIDEYKKRMDKMAEDFSQMLQETIKKMGEKIAITSHWNLDQDYPVVRSFESHSLIDPKTLAQLNLGGSDNK